MTKTNTSSSESQYKKKSTPSGAPIPQQDYGTTPEEKSEAERLFDGIGVGAYYAVKRPKDAKVDRQLRRLIADANMNGDCIINDGSGYFRAGEEDEIAFETYMKAEWHKINESRKKLKRMREVFERRYQ